jgi:small subunit ribosomal protein S20
LAFLDRSHATWRIVLILELLFWRYPWRISICNQAHASELQSAACVTAISPVARSFVRGACESKLKAESRRVLLRAAAIPALDKAAEKGVVHKNNAARRKSRLMKRLAAPEENKLLPVFPTGLGLPVDSARCAAPLSFCDGQSLVETFRRGVSTFAYAPRDIIQCFERPPGAVQVRLEALLEAEQHVIEAQIQVYCRQKGLSELDALS